MSTDRNGDCFYYDAIFLCNRPDLMLNFIYIIVIFCYNIKGEKNENK